MTAAKHTPGPWSISTSCSFRRISSDATGRDGDVLHAVVQRSDGHPDLHFPNGGFEGPDARLIAAAPELLEALIDARSMLAVAIRSAVRDMQEPGEPEFDVRQHRGIRKIDSAIAKATGGSQ